MLELAPTYLFAVRAGEEAGRPRGDLQAPRVVHEVAEVTTQHDPALSTPETRRKKHAKKEESKTSRREGSFLVLAIMSTAKERWVVSAETPPSIKHVPLGCGIGGCYRPRNETRKLREKTAVAIAG